MPELPEVEIAARNLRRWAEGKRISRVATDPRAARIFRPGDRGAFARALAGARLEKVDRRGKHLLVTLADRRGHPVGLWSHLGMTGKWVLREASDPEPTHARVRLDLDDGRTLLYLDPRLFGRQRIVPRADFAALPEVAALGPDPVHDGIDPGRLAERLRATRRAVKVALLDQAVLAGVGNIHASESLFAARIDPRRARWGALPGRGPRAGQGHRGVAPPRDRDAGRSGDRLRRGAGGAEPVPRLRTGRGALSALP